MFSITLDVIIAIICTIFSAQGFAKGETGWGIFYAVLVAVNMLIISSKLKANETISSKKK